MITIWKPIPGIEDYEINENGEIRRRTPACGTYPGKIIKQHKTSTGYMGVILSKNNHPINYLVHRLVALTFIRNTYNLPEVNHINLDKTDNRVENLEWCSHEYNMIHFSSRYKFHQTRRKRTGKIIICMETGKKYKGLNDVAEYFNVTPQYVSNHLIKEGKSFHGLHFRRLEDIDKS